MAMTYAATRPDRVARLVLCGTFTRFSDESREAFGRFLAERESDPRFAEAVAARRAREENPPADEDELGRLALLGLPLLFGRFGEREQAFVARAAEASGGYHLPALTYFNEHVAPTFDLRPLLPKIQPRTLVITGELIRGERGAAAEIASLIRDARVVVLPEVGHMPWIEDPERFRLEVTNFLS